MSYHILEGGTDMQSGERNGEQGTDERTIHDRFDGNRMDMQSRQLNDYENFNRNDDNDGGVQISGLDRFESSTDYDNNYDLLNTNEQQMNSETALESQSFSQSQEIQDSSLRQTLAQYPNLPIPGRQVPAARQLPVPNIPLMNQMARAEESGFSQNDSFSSYRETRRSSRDTRESSFNDMNNTRETADSGQQTLVLPSPSVRRVSFTRPVELTLPRSTFEALQNQNSEESNIYSEGRMSRRRSIPVVLDSPNGEVLREIRLTDDSSRRLSDLSDIRRSFSESNLLDIDQGAISNRQVVRFSILCPDFKESYRHNNSCDLA